MEVLNKACHVCGRQKQQTNHWYVAIVDPAQKATGNSGIGFGPSDAQIDDRHLYIVEDICGQECAHKRLDRWFESQTSNTQPGKESVIA